MKYTQQFCLILLISFAGELCHILIPLPIPASIYGLMLMLILLQSGIIHLHQIEDTARFLIAIMPVMFIPAAVGLMDTFAILRPIWLPFTLIMLLSTIIVMAITGRCTQAILNHEQKRKEPSEAHHE